MCGLWIALWSVGRAQSKVEGAHSFRVCYRLHQEPMVQWGLGCTYAVSQRATITATGLSE